MNANQHIHTQLHPDIQSQQTATIEQLISDRANQLCLSGNYTATHVSHFHCQVFSLFHINQQTITRFHSFNL